MIERKKYPDALIRRQWNHRIDSGTFCQAFRCDTLTCIAGGMAEAFYGVPDDLKAECRSRLPLDMVKVLERFDQLRSEGRREPE